MEKVEEGVERWRGEAATGGEESLVSCSPTTTLSPPFSVYCVCLCERPVD